MTAAAIGKFGMTHKFILSIGMIGLGAWTKASGLSIQWDVTEHRAGNTDGIYAYAGVPKYQRVKLQRALDKAGYTKTETWLKKVQSTGGTTAETASIKMLDGAGKPVVTWTLSGVFPASWSISEFDANSGKVVVETLELAHEGFLRPIRY